MPDLIIYTYRESGGDGQYVVIEDDFIEPDEHTIPGYYYAGRVDCDAMSLTDILPLGTLLFKNN